MTGTGSLRGRADGRGSRQVTNTKYKRYILQDDQKNKGYLGNLRAIFHTQDSDLILTVLNRTVNVEPFVQIDPQFPNK